MHSLSVIWTGIDRVRVGFSAIRPNHSVRPVRAAARQRQGAPDKDHPLPKAAHDPT